MSTRDTTYDAHSISPDKWWRTVPEAVELVLDHGHEIGCHGYDYSLDRAFDLMDRQETIQNRYRAAE
ncbi:MAG: hypothetical protein U9N12_08005 [Euryarchaeota archaeon]|nr:hypothetical protein [Euryarchaeota archaeon]